MKELQNLLNNSLIVLGILTGNENPHLDTVIQSGSSLAVKARLHKGNYQLTAKSLELAIQTIDPEIVNDIIKAGQQVTSRDIYCALCLSLPYENSFKLRNTIIETLMNAIKNKGDELDPNLLMHLIQEDGASSIAQLLEFDVKVTAEHLSQAYSLFNENADRVKNYNNNHNNFSLFKEHPPQEYKYSYTLKILERAWTKQERQEGLEKQESFKNFKLMGEGSRCASAFFINTSTVPAKIPTEVMFKIGEMAENKKYPLDEAVKERVFYKHY